MLASDTPNQLADRLAILQSVGTAGNAMIADLTEDRADLVNSAGPPHGDPDAAGGRPAAAAATLLDRGQQQGEGAGRSSSSPRSSPRARPR